MPIDWLWGIVGAIGGLIVLVVIVAFLINSAFTLLAAKILKVENATFGRAMLATFLGGLAGAGTSLVLGLLFSPLLIAGSVLIVSKAGPTFVGILPPCVFQANG